MVQMCSAQPAMTEGGASRRPPRLDARVRCGSLAYLEITVLLKQAQVVSPGISAQERITTEDPLAIAPWVHVNVLPTVPRLGGSTYAALATGVAVCHAPPLTETSVSRLFVRMGR